MVQIRAAIKIDHLSGFLGMELLKDESKSLFSTNWLCKISCGIIPGLVLKRDVEICCCVVVHMCTLFPPLLPAFFVVNKSINRKLLGSREGGKKSSTIS